MEIPFELPELLSRDLSIKSGSIFNDPVLLVDGKPAPRGKDGSFTVVGENGVPVVVRLIPRGIDLVPDVRVGEGDTAHTVVVMPALRWYEYIWCLLPLFVLLVIFRGPISGLVGALITYLNLRLFRGERTVFASYAVTAFASLGSLAAYYGIARAMLSFFQH